MPTKPNREKCATPSNPDNVLRVSRRTTLQMLGTAFATTPLTAALGCGSTETSNNAGAEGAVVPNTAQPAAAAPASASQSSNAAARGGAAQAGTGQASKANPSTMPVTGGAPSTAGTSSTPAPTAGSNALASAGQGAAGQSSGAMATTAPAAGQGATSTAGAGANAMQIVGWAMGGTASIATNAYPSPFGNKLDASCVRTEPMTLGPCHDNQAPEREDISEGRPGLPVRFGLRVVNEKCEPIANANVDIWHCDTEGVYSSETSDFASYCTGNMAAAQSAHWFRGYRQVDETGTAWFNTCFPGWYPSRALHFHVTVRRSSRQGMEALTTQLGFDPKLGEEICTTHPDYKDHGKPDTSNMADNTFVGSNYNVETMRMPDGVMLVWKTLVIPS